MFGKGIRDGSCAGAKPTQECGLDVVFYSNNYDYFF